MRAFARVLAVLSCLVLAAHFLRHAMVLRATGSPLAGLSFALVVCALALPFLLLLRAAFWTTLVRVVLAVAVLEWVRYLWEMALRRRAAGEPWVRAVAILSSVAVLTALAALLLRPARDARDTESAGSSR